MAVSKIFSGNIEISKTVKSIPVNSSIILEVVDEYTIDQAMKAITASSAVRKNNPKNGSIKVATPVKIKLEAIRGLTGQQLDKVVKLVKITRFAD